MSISAYYIFESTEQYYLIGALMQNTEIINPVSKPKFVNYQICPWWVLEHCRQRPISVTGKVTLTCQNFIIIDMEPARKKMFKIEVKLFEMTYTYSNSQYRKVQSLSNYNNLKLIEDPEELQSDLSAPEKEPHQNPFDAENEEDPIVGENEEKQQNLEQQIQGEAEVPQIINGQYFKLGSVIEVRGRFVQPHCFVMQQFSILNSNLDLNNYNKMLRIITDKMPSIYY